MTEVEPETPISEPSTRDFGAVASDDFLYHLTRGSEFFKQGKTLEAKQELERALQLQPQDDKGQSLLASVYYRLAQYDLAGRVYDELIRMFPHNPSLRVNLALSALKKGDLSQALTAAKAAVELMPTHTRAWGYLGLIHWRLGEVQLARDAFVQAHQKSMVRRMDELLEVTEAHQAESFEERDEIAALRVAAERAIERLEASAAPLELSSGVFTDSQSQWHAWEPGKEEGLWQEAEPEPTEPGTEKKAVFQSFFVPQKHKLVVETEKSVYTRAEGLTLIAAQTPPQRVEEPPSKGRASAKPARGWLRWQGPLQLIFSGEVEKTFFVIERVQEWSLYVHEPYLWAYDATLTVDAIAVEIGQKKLPVVQLQGHGSVILKLPSAPLFRSIQSSDEVLVSLNTLVGWRGRLIPLEGVLPDGVRWPSGQTVAMRGTGTLMVL